MLCPTKSGTNKARMSALTFLFNFGLEVLLQTIRQEKIHKRHLNYKRSIKLFLFATDMIFYTDNLKEVTKKLPELIKQFSKVTRYKVNIQK